GLRDDPARDGCPDIPDAVAREPAGGPPARALRAILVVVQLEVGFLGGGQVDQEREGLLEGWAQCGRGAQLDQPQVQIALPLQSGGVGVARTIGVHGLNLDHHRLEKQSNSILHHCPAGSVAVPGRAPLSRRRTPASSVAPAFRGVLWEGKRTLMCASAWTPTRDSTTPAAWRTPWPERRSTRVWRSTAGFRTRATGASSRRCRRGCWRGAEGPAETTSRQARSRGCFSTRPRTAPRGAGAEGAGETPSRQARSRGCFSTRPRTARWEACA